jgi:hypothetical protein
MNQMLIIGNDLGKLKGSGQKIDQALLIKLRFGKERACFGHHSKYLGRPQRGFHFSANMYMMLACQLRTASAG